MSKKWEAASALVGHQAWILSSILIVIIAGFLRFHDLSERSIWLDEAFAANNSRGTVSDMMKNTREKNSSPILYPLILHGVQKINESEFAVRLPSAIAGILSVVVMLLLPRVGIDRRIAIIAGTILAVSSTQIRYSQEVREYTLAIFTATVMLYGLLSRAQGTGKERKVLYVTMLIAPLVQYGLGLLGAAMLATLTLESLRQHKFKVAIQGVATPAILLAVGSAVSYILTLRYQLGLKSDWWYLKSWFYEGQVYNFPKVLVFVVTKTFHLFNFMTEGELLVGLAIPAIGIMAHKCAQAPKGENSVSWTILSLMIASIIISASAAIGHVYPYGGIRQSLYLSPIIALVVGSSYVAVAAGMSRDEGRIWFALVLSLVLIAGAWDIKSRNPYAEVENIKSVISTLEHSVNDKETVYVYWGSKPGLDFYKKRRENFVYGSYHRQGEADDYIREFERLVGLNEDHVWLVFSHVVFGEEKLLLEHLKPLWNIEKKVDAEGASLYFAVRRRTE